MEEIGTSLKPHMYNSILVRKNQVAMALSIFLKLLEGVRKRTHGIHESGKGRDVAARVVGVHPYGGLGCSHYGLNESDGRRWLWDAGGWRKKTCECSAPSRSI